MKTSILALAVSGANSKTTTYLCQNVAGFRLYDERFNTLKQQTSYFMDHRFIGDWSYIQPHIHDVEFRLANKQISYFLENVFSNEQSFYIGQIPNSQQYESWHSILSFQSLINEVNDIIDADLKNSIQGVFYDRNNNLHARRSTF